MLDYFLIFLLVFEIIDAITWYINYFITMQR